MTPFLLAAPWLALLLFVVFVARLPTELAAAPSRTANGRTDEGETVEGVAAAPPTVSIIVPARNEAVNIVKCVESLLALDYPDFEVVVVDDRSEDETAALARSAAFGSGARVTVLEGEPLPEGWLGKPWACWQGARVATGDVLLFTDADTRHGPTLLSRAVAAAREEEADLLTLVGRQLMETFWERMVQPHVFLMMLTRFPDFERVAKNDRWRDAIANGQYLLFRRSAYDAIGGHGAVRDEVVEDMALAQRVKRAGLRLRLRSAEDELATRMYRSLDGLIEGWSKNMVMGGLQSFPPALRPVVAPASGVASFVVGLAAPSVLLVGLLAWIGGGVAFGGFDLAVGERVVESGGGTLAIGRGALVWASTVYVLTAATLTWFSRRMGAPARYGLIYPIGSAMVWYILMRSWVRGRRVEWKGREYRLPPASERP